MAVLSTTLATLREGFLSTIGGFYGFTAASDGAADGTTIVDATNLPRFANDKFNTWQALLTLGTYSGQVRPVKDFVSSTGTLTLNSAYGGKVLATVTYELCRFHPTDDLRQVFNKALKEIYPALGKWVNNFDLIAGNWLPNGDMEDWDSSSYPNKWPVVGATATAAAETTIKLFGSKSAKLTRAGTDCYIHCSDTEWPALLDLGGKTGRFEAWVYATVADRARLNILVNGVSVAASSYHTGGSTWELLRTDEITITDSPTSIDFRAECNTGNTSVYFERMRFIGPPLATYLMPLGFSLERPQQVSIQQVGTAHGSERPCDDHWAHYPFRALTGWSVDYDNDLGAWLLHFQYAPPAGYTIKLYGKEYLASVSSDTDVVPFEGGQAEMFYAYAAMLLYEKFKDIGQAKYWEDRFDKLRKQHGMPQVPIEMGIDRW